MGTKGRRLSEKQDREIAEMYRQIPNISAIRKKLGYHFNTVARSLRRQGIDYSPRRTLETNPTLVGRDEIIADTILKRIEKNPDLYSKNFSHLARTMGSAGVIGVLRNPEKYRETVVEDAKIALLMTLSAMISDGKLAEASLSALAQIIPVLCDVASGKYPLNAGFKLF